MINIAKEVLLKEESISILFYALSILYNINLD